MTRTNRYIRFALVALLAASLGGCRKQQTGAGRERTDEYDRRIRDKWGKSLDELPVRELVVVSPHNRNIEEEFASAFELRHALEHGERPEIEYANLGGSSQILERLRSYYRDADLSKGTDYDVLFGGGEINFMKMAAEGILQPMEIPEEYRQNVPARLGGLELYDPNGMWYGAALSGFGFLYNRDILGKLEIAPPELWDDLGAPRFHNLLALADPMKSGSAAAAYEMVVQSAPDWPSGWAKLLGILGNAKKFYDGASAAADAVISEAPVATCIDFYGTMRVNKYPDQLVYVSPRGQTAYTPDPIGILRGTTRRQTARRFVEFVLSREGQALWCLPPGAEDGPVESPLGRTPVRRDVFADYGDRMLDAITSPYRVGARMSLDIELREVRFGVLRNLVNAAAVVNSNELSDAAGTLIARGYPPELTAEFNALPENVRTLEQIRRLAEDLKDPTKGELITTGWQQYFRDKFRRISE